MEKGQYDLRGIAISENQIGKIIQANNADAKKKLTGGFSSQERKRILVERDAQNADKMDAQTQKVEDAQSWSRLPSKRRDN